MNRYRVLKFQFFSAEIKKGNRNNINIMAQLWFEEESGPKTYKDSMIQKLI